MSYATHESLTIYCGLTTRNGTRVNRAFFVEFVAGLSKAYEGLTLTWREGFWKGEHETSATIELILPIDHAQTNGGENTARWIGEQLATHFNQECCAYKVVPCRFDLTSRSASYVRHPLPDNHEGATDGNRETALPAEEYAGRVEPHITL